MCPLLLTFEKQKVQGFLLTQVVVMCRLITKIKCVIPSKVVSKEKVSCKLFQKQKSITNSLHDSQLNSIITKVR